MDIFNILELVGGLALFLFGMNLMGDSLEKRAGNQLKNILGKLTSSRWIGFVLGAGVTAIIQSSSATTVMVVGFVNSGIMNLKQAINIIMGANVGTTITSWLLSLTGIESSNIFVELLKPSSFVPILAIIGVIMIMRKKNSKSADTGMILLGFSVLMFGMETMSSAVSPLKDVPEFQNILTMFKNPVLGVLAGALLTAIIQSSSASVGILQALTATGAVTYASAIPIIMGQNIGTCVTALVSSIGANKNAKRTAVVHLSFNIIGTVVWLTVFLVVNHIVNISFIDQSASVFSIAIIHSVFNILCTLLLFPFAKQLEKLACFIIRDKDEGGESLKLLDSRLMANPSIAIDRSRKVLLDMYQKTVACVEKACGLIENYDEKILKEVVEEEGEVDRYESDLGAYLVKISTQNLSAQDSENVSGLLHIISDIERMSDYSVDIAKSAEEMHDNQYKFSDSAMSEMRVIIRALKDCVYKLSTALSRTSTEDALNIETMEYVVDQLKEEMKERHIVRLKNGKCTIEQGFIMTDMITNMERISDHCASIASKIEEINESTLGIRAYKDHREKEPDERFQKVYEKNREHYSLEEKK